MCQALGFPGGSDSKESTCNVRDLSSIPGLGRSPGEGNSNPLQYSCLENPRNGGAWWAAVYGVTQSRTRLKRLSSSMHIYIYYIYNFIHLCLAALGLHCCMRSFSSCSDWGLLSCCTAAASLVVERGLNNCGTRASLLHSMWDLSSY